MPDNRAASPPKLFILASTYNSAQAFANRMQLMPGWVYLNRPSQLLGRDRPTVLEIPGYEWTTEMRDMVEYRRGAVLRDHNDLDPWRRPDARRIPGPWLVGCTTCSQEWEATDRAAAVPQHNKPGSPPTPCPGAGRAGEVLQDLSPGSPGVLRAAEVVKQLDQWKYAPRFDLPGVQVIPPHTWVMVTALPGLKVRHSLGHSSWVAVRDGSPVVGHPGQWEMQWEVLFESTWPARYPREVGGE